MTDSRVVHAVGDPERVIACIHEWVSPQADRFEDDERVRFVGPSLDISCYRLANPLVELDMSTGNGACHDVVVWSGHDSITLTLALAARLRQHGVRVVLDRDDSELIEAAQAGAISPDPLGY